MTWRLFLERTMSERGVGVIQILQSCCSTVTTEWTPKQLLIWIDVLQINLQEVNLVDLLLVEQKRWHLFVQSFSVCGTDCLKKHGSVKQPPTALKPTINLDQDEH